MKLSLFLFLYNIFFRSKIRKLRELNEIMDLPKNISVVLSTNTSVGSVQQGYAGHYKYPGIIVDDLFFQMNLITRDFSKNEFNKMFLTRSSLCKVIASAAQQKNKEKRKNGTISIHLSKLHWNMDMRRVK